MTTNVLLLGSGGREHAIALSLRRSRGLGQLFVAPGNPGIAAVATCVSLDVDDHAAVVAFCALMAVGLVVVGPEAPLVAGLVDDLDDAGIPAFGPCRAAAQLEGSKAFCKGFCRRFGIPTAAYEHFDAEAPALAYLRARGAPIVVKADGLAAGKGVVVAATLAEAETAVVAMFGGAFGSAGRSVVIEDVLVGEEASFFALCDGHRATAFASAQDHKRLLDGDRGPNTGGMGAYSPAPIVTAEIASRVMREIVEPTMSGMAGLGTPFRGVLFVGLMIGPHGPRVIEFNVRFGDPETQVMLARLQDDLLELLLGCAQGRLTEAPVSLSAEHALTVVLAAPGYPEAPRQGDPIGDLDAASRLEGVIVTQAGTRRTPEGLVVAGGRVLNVTGIGDDLATSQARAYAGVAAVAWPGALYRRDIGWRARPSS